LKKKSFISKKNVSRCQYQNKKDLFNDPIFSEDFEFAGRDPTQDGWIKKM
jgi:hypothetical protein